jgi:hypothetical protein
MIMRTLSKMMIAAGFIGTIAGAGTTAAVAQGVYLQGPGFGVDIGRPAYRERHYRGYSDYDSSRFYSERRNPIPAARSVTLTVQSGPGDASLSALKEGKSKSEQMSTGEDRFGAAGNLHKTHGPTRFG